MLENRDIGNYIVQCLKIITIQQFNKYYFHKNFYRKNIIINIFIKVMVKLKLNFQLYIIYVITKNIIVASIHVRLSLDIYQTQL